MNWRAATLTGILMMGLVMIAAADEMALEAVESAGAPAVVAAAASASSVSTGAVLCQHTDAKGEVVACETGASLEKIIAWYKASLEERERRIQLEKELEEFEVDP